MIEFPFDQPQSYIRVQTSYFKKSLQPTITGDFKEIWIPWSADVLKMDLGRNLMEKIRKFDGFCCVPDHINYQENIGNFFNLYQPLSWKPEPGKCDAILSFLRHIFGEQYELGLDYISLLYNSPTQKLPVLCLVSKERKTGKTTFLNLLKIIFGANMTFNGNNDFRSQFNSDWMNTLIIAVDEVLLDRREDSEKIKNLSTAKTSKIEAKGKDRKETQFFGKFILCSNNEENFIVIDSTETRYWIRKIPVLTKEKTDLLDEMENQVPPFLFYLQTRPLSVPYKMTRMYFSENQIRTDALFRVIKNNRNRLQTEALFLFKEILETTGDKKFYFTNKDLIVLLNKTIPRLTRHQISNLLQQEWQLEPAPNSLSYITYYYDKNNELTEIHSTGRYYTITEEWINLKFDEKWQ
jgi:hypothetical protein